MIIIETWKTVMDREHLFHFTADGHVVRTGLRGDNARRLFITKKNVLNFSGMGRLASVAFFRETFNDMRGWKKTK